MNPSIFTIVGEVVISVLVVLFVINFASGAFDKEPELFDSLLCSKHTPTGAILVTDELIMCNQVIYRRVK